MKSFKEQMDIYNNQHTNSTNKIAHFIGIPAIIFGGFMLLNWISIDFGSVWKISFAWLVLIAGAAYYFILGNYKLAAATTVLAAILLLIAALIAGPYPSAFSGILCLALFVGGWALLLMGHGIFEKNKPAFIKSLSQMAIAPLFLTAELLSLCGLDMYTDKD